PLGTGNDLCRTLAVPLDPVAAAGLLPAGERRAIDVIRVEGAGSGFAVNAVTGGFSGRVAAGVASELKGVWGPVGYLRGALGVGDYVEDENVVHRRAGRVEVESDPPLPVSLDGELSEGSRFVFEAVPRALRVVVGPDYVPDPEPPPPPTEPDEDEPDDPRP